MRRFLLTVVGSLMMALALPAADKSPEPTAERIALVRRMYEKLPADVFGVVEPVNLAGVGFSYSDGKIRVRNVVLKDAKGKELEIWLGSWWDEVRADSLTLSGNKKARLHQRGPEESAVYGMLLRLPKEEREGAAVAKILEILDSRFAGAMPGSARK
jgi:hypothetical protein